MDLENVRSWLYGNRRLRLNTTKSEELFVGSYRMSCPSLLMGDGNDLKVTSAKSLNVHLDETLGQHKQRRPRRN